MRDSAQIISVCLTAFLLCGGCSRKEPPPVKETKVVKPIQRPAPEKTKTPLSDRDERAKDEVMEAGEVRSAAVEKVAATPPEKEARQKEKAGKEVAGYYIVKKGEGLSGIASRGDVYGDPLKWPFLCRRNLDNSLSCPLGNSFRTASSPRD